MKTCDASAFNARWEKDVYAQGRQINRYPFPIFIGPFLGLYGRAPDRSAIEVLEIGCGAGNNVWFFAREGFTTHAIDGSASALAYAQDRLAGESLKADLRQGDFQSLPFADNSMDFILDRCSITHNTRPAIHATIAEARRVLKPGGAFFSQMFASDHSDLTFARDFLDGSASDFSDSNFAGIGRTFFASRADLDEFFAKSFEVKWIEHEIHENVLTGHVGALWNVLMRKAG